MNILLVCGVGASTGFMAQNMRKVAKKRSMDATIRAVSKAELMDYVEEIDVLMIGPHYRLQEANIREDVEPYGVKVVVIDSEFYANLDGDGILDQAIKVYDSK